MKCCNVCQYHSVDSDEEPCASCSCNRLSTDDFFEKLMSVEVDATADLRRLPLGSAAEERRRAILWMQTAHTNHCNAEYWIAKYQQLSATKQSVCPLLDLCR